MQPATRDDQDLAAESGTPTHAVSDDAVLRRLLADPTHADFFLAVRWLAAVAARAAGPGATGVGEGDLPRHEPIRFSQEISLRFAPSTLHSIRRSEAGQFEVDVRFFGLCGPQGPMPMFVSEEAIRRRLDEKDTALDEFLDIFNDRMIAHFYRAWAIHQFCVAADAGAVERFDRYVGSLAGFGVAEERARGSIGAGAKLHYTGLLRLETKPAGSLEALLADDLDATVQLEPFVGRWVDIPVPMRCRLGDASYGTRLGVSAVVGERAWEVRQRFGLRVGPIDYEKFRRLLPGAALQKRMAEWVFLFNGSEFACEATLVLRADEVPPPILGDGERDKCRLGRTLWLTSKPFSHDPDDAVFSVVN